jgi:hypothetical protein
VDYLPDDCDVCLEPLVGAEAGGCWWCLNFCDDDDCGMLHHDDCCGCNPALMLKTAKAMQAFADELRKTPGRLT